MILQVDFTSRFQIGKMSLFELSILTTLLLEIDVQSDDLKDQIQGYQQFNSYNTQRLLFLLM